MIQNIKQVSIVFTLLFTTIILSSCSGVKEMASFENLGKSNCYNQADYHYTFDELPKLLEMQIIDSNLSQNFSFEALNIANAFNFLNLLIEFNNLKYNHLQNPTIENNLKLIELKLAITQKINIASLEISSVTSELDCEEERATQVANFLKGKVEKREKNLVIGSIIVGAVGAITTEGLNNSSSAGKSGSYVAIGTAITEAILGVLMLANKKKIEFVHERNTPGEIWTGPLTSKTLSPSIWYYLNYKDSENRKTSLRNLLTEHWETYGQVEKKTKNKIKDTDEIYFGLGGKYTFEQLENRADMYDQIESYINLMKQDLKTLSVEFEKFSVKNDQQ